MKKSIAECLSVIGARRTDIENWHGLELRTKYEPTVRGRARRYSRSNILELASVAAFVRIGMPVGKAIAFAGPIVDNLDHERREWAIFVGGDFDKTIWTDDLAATVGAIQLDDGKPPVFALVNLGEVRRRVARLFDVETVGA